MALILHDLFWYLEQVHGTAPETGALKRDIARVAGKNMDEIEAALVGYSTYKTNKKARPTSTFGTQATNASKYATGK